MNITILLRKINKNRRYFFINIVGLSLALSSLLLVFSFVKNELSFDRFHSKADRIYRLTQNTNTGISSMIDARFFTASYSELNGNHPEIEQITGLSSFRKTIITINNNSFYSTKAFRADSSFFEVFDFELLVGNKETLFKIPDQAAITESMAMKYFGTTDVVGKQIKLMHQRINEAKIYTIKGVLKDFPTNSHFKAEILCSYPKTNNSLWAYTYVLLSKGADYNAVQDSIQSDWDEELKDRGIQPLVNLQPLTDIHLHSHKTRELEANGNINTLILLISGVLIILIIALINFINLNYVQFLSQLKNIKIRIVNGASRFIIAKEFISEIIVLLIFVNIISFLFIDFFVDYLHLSFYSSKQELIILSLSFSILILLIALIPLLYRKNRGTTNLILSNRKSYQISLLIQLLLSIVAIASTLFIQKQINFTNNIHPKAKDASVIVLPNNPSEAIKNFELLKEQLLKYPEIKSVCGVMEEPAGPVIDNFRYTYNSDTTTESKTINVFVVDDDFLSFMNIKPIAGSVDLGVIPSFEWEQKAIKLWYAEDYGAKMPENPEEVRNYIGKYIINKTALKHLGIKNPEDAIGKEFQINHQMKYLFPKGKIIGVVDDFHYSSIHDKDKPMAIIPIKMFCHTFLIRIDTNNQAKALSIVEEQWNEINEGIPFNYEFITDSYQKVYKNEYMQMQVLMLFAFISILLSLIGMYAMIAFKLKLQTKEIGIRKVNGATTLEIIKMLNKDFIILTAVSFIIAVPISYFAMEKWLENFAYKTPLSWWVFALAGIVAVALTVLTVSAQSLGVALKNPVEALKYE